MIFNYFNYKTEQGVLRISIAGTLVLAFVGIILGLMASSAVIIFDSIYETADAVMTFFALLVARLIAASTSGDMVNSKLNERFTMGFWHLEPIVLGLNGVLLVGAATYALVNAVDSFLSGGRNILFDYAVAFAVISIIMELGIGLFVRRANKKISSDFLALDSKAWLMSAAMSVAYLAAFGFGYFATGTSLAWVTPFIDPAVLAIVCLAVIPLPFGTIRQAVADILLVTPPDLKHQVDEVAKEIVRKYGFDSYRAYVARVGRGRQIELYFIVPHAWPAKKLEEWDRLRDEIEKEMGGDNPDMWLTIVFTADPEWAE